MDDDWDPYADRTPWLRRRGVRLVVALLAAGSLALVTLISTCAPRRRVPATTTTTVGRVAVEALPAVTPPGIAPASPSGR
jgi:type IV secretory pathway protease TraF